MSWNSSDREVSLSHLVVLLVLDRVWALLDEQLQSVEVVHLRCPVHRRPP